MKLQTLAKAFLVMCLFCGLVSAKQMILTTLDGIKIVLKDDNTWLLESGKTADFENDFTVPVSGGKIVLVATDGTWGFVEKELIDETVLVTADSIVGNGHSVNLDVVAANAAAQKQALTQVTTRMRNALVKLKIDQKLLPDCVKRVEKDITKKEDFKQGTGWDVSIRMFLDRGSILAVAECAGKKDEPPPEPKKSAEPKKTTEQKQ